MENQVLYSNNTQLTVAIKFKNIVLPVQYRYLYWKGYLKKTKSILLSDKN